MDADPDRAARSADGERLTAEKERRLPRRQRELAEQAREPALAHPSSQGVAVGQQPDSGVRAPRNLPSA